MKKSITQMLEECKEIRKQLQSVGATIDEENNKRLSACMNDFIKKSESQHVSLKIDDRASAVVILSANSKMKSGVTLERIK